MLRLPLKRLLDFAILVLLIWSWQNKPLREESIAIILILGKGLRSVPNPSTISEIQTRTWTLKSTPWPLNKSNRLLTLPLNRTSPMLVEEEKLTLYLATIMLPRGLTDGEIKYTISWLYFGINILPVSESNFLKRWAISAIFTLSEAFGSNSLQYSKIFVDLNALLEICEKLFAIWYLKSSLNSVVVETLSKSSFVWETRKLIICLVRIKATLYSSKANGTSFTRLRWFSGRSRRWRCDLE